MKPVQLLFFVTLLAGAQSGIAQAKESDAIIKKKSRPVISLQIDVPAKQVRKAWKESNLWSNLDAQKQQSYTSYRLAPMPAWGGDTVNVYTRVQAIDGDKSVIIVAVSRPDGSFISTQTDSLMASKIKQSLYDFASQQHFPSVDADIQKYSDSIELDLAAYNTYLSEKKKLEMQHTRLTERINELERKYEKDKVAWQLRKQRLDELRKTRDIAKD